MTDGMCSIGGITRSSSDNKSSSEMYEEEASEPCEDDERCS